MDLHRHIQTWAFLILAGHAEFPSRRFCDGSFHSFSFLSLNLFFSPHFCQVLIVFMVVLYSIHASYSGQGMYIMGAEN